MAIISLKTAHSYPLPPPMPCDLEIVVFLLLLFMFHNDFSGWFMAHLTNFVPKLPTFNSLGEMMSCTIFTIHTLNPLIGSQTHTHPSKYLPKRDVTLSSPPIKYRGMSLLPHIKAKLAKFLQQCQNIPCWHIPNVNERHVDCNVV